MKFWDLIKIANRNLSRSKLRTLLTILAIFVGSFTLVLTNGLGDGLRDYVERQVKNIEGANVLFVQKKFRAENDDAKPGEPAEYKETAAAADESANPIDPNSYSITTAQAESLIKEMPEIKKITPRYHMDGEYITLDGEKKYRLRLGMLSEGVSQKTEAGRTVNGANQILIPLALAKVFDADVQKVVGRDAIIAYKVGQAEEIKTLRLKIVGVATKGFMTNENSFVDEETARRIYEEQGVGSNEFGKFAGFTMLLKTSAPQTIADYKQKFDAQGFTAETFADRGKRTYDGIGILQIGLNFFALIALLAASFGIINTLVIAVMERTREIGLQKALGMGRGKIFLLFSLESVLIGFWGALCGVIGGIVVGILTNIILGRTYLESFEGYSLFSFKPLSILFVMLLVCAIAFLAGVFPALRASRLNPIEALRYE